ncbi:MAG: hypothetical protein QOK30_914 [Nocardioidaceae bacterium]|jgi:hypothetical protein|nr:hypothetical protein [Nocardioidaceae bacterium]
MVLTACTGTGPTTGPVPSPHVASAASAALSTGPGPRKRDTLSRAVLQAQQRALRHRRLRAFQATWAAQSSARRQGDDIASNLRAVRASVLSLRLRPAAAAEPASRPRRGHFGAAWDLTVDVRWRTPQMGARDVVSSLVYTFVAAEGSARVAAVRASAGSREPIWLVGRLRVARGRGPVVAVAGSVAQSRVLVRRLLLARHDVRTFLTHWHGSLTAYLPRSTADFAAVLDAGRRQYASVAAVTAAIDGSAEPHAPVAVVVNPRIWPRLTPLGARVVIIHEAVHAATGPRTTALPRWLSEGFADFVAIQSARVPPRLANAAAVEDIRRHGLPRRLPMNSDFNAGSAQLEATYEESRLVVQAIADQAGLQRLVAFYTAVAAHSVPADTALRTRLGTSRAQLTRQWRRLLIRLRGAQ